MEKKDEDKKNELNTSALSSLREYLIEQTNGLKIPHLETKNTPKTYRTEQEKKIASSLVISGVFKKISVKQKLARNPFGVYVALFDDLDTTQAVLSARMFGQHQAEIGADSNWRIQNPMIFPDRRAYHRSHNIDEGSFPLLKELLLTFDISEEEFKKGKYSYFIASQSKLSPIQSILSSLNLANGVTQIENTQNTAVLIKMDNNTLEKGDIDKIFDVLSASGVTSSPWALATYTQTTPLNIEKQYLLPLNKNIKTAYPQSKQALLSSPIISTLRKTDTNYPTHQLAQALLLLLQNAPDPLETPAIQRIGLILDNANTFYRNNYPRFAFCLYVVVHEITLALAKQNDEISLHDAFQNFLNEAESALKNALDIQENPESTEFIAAPALSGMNAYHIAMQLAKNMQSPNGNPTVCVVPPTYYECNTITQNTIPFNQEISPNADIYFITTGPIVTMDGLCSGVDINKFIKRHIIDAQRQDHTTLVVDATTTLYKNLHLNDDAKRLLIDGKLSIIVCESHQKFGLLHTDQAQYGRIFCLCSKAHYSTELLNQFQLNAKEDFNQHVDMRIGAFISSHCGELLESIKEQHFKYGNTLRKMLGDCKKEPGLVINAMVPHQDHLQNEEENYFVTINNTNTIALSILESRDSFGHFSTTVSSINVAARLCPGASDFIDSLLEGSKLCISSIPADSLSGALISMQDSNKKNISLEKQILILAILEYLTKDIISKSRTKHPKLYVMRSIGLALTIPKSLDQCSDLRGREYYMNIQEHYVSHHPKLLTPPDVKHPKKFLHAIKICYQQSIILLSIDRFKEEIFCDFVIFFHGKKFLGPSIKKSPIFFDLLFTQKENEIKEFLLPEHSSNTARQNLLCAIEKHFSFRVEWLSRIHPNPPSLAICKFAQTQARSETLDREAFIDIVLLTKADRENDEITLQEYKQKYGIQDLQIEVAAEEQDEDDDENEKDDYEQKQDPSFR